MFGNIRCPLFDTFKPVLHVGWQDSFGWNGRIGISHDYSFGGRIGEDLHTTGRNDLHFDTFAVFDLKAATRCQRLSDLCAKVGDSGSCQQKAEEVAERGK